MVTSYAYYRLPYADTYTLISSERAPQQMEWPGSMGSVSGFVLAPFRESGNARTLLILPDKVSTYELLSTEGAGKQHEDSASDIPSAAYASAFKAFHTAVWEGRFQKLVLARSKTISLAFPVDFRDPELMRGIFEKACRMYPRLMVMLFFTPESGAWLVASPEILLDSMGHSMHTVALAGTMPFTEGHIQWSEKNKLEQHIVEKYIQNILLKSSDDLVKDGPVTTRAGNLVHLRTDFRFHLKSGASLGSLVSRLHPTPAVCGMPKEEAIDFIASNEGLDRSYYSGFAGPAGIDSQTHLYVSLRCAHFTSRQEAELYAGGGIMPDSDCLSEWLETEFKLNTIQNVLQ